MIPLMNITAWTANAPWAEIRQVEQDLIISRAQAEQRMFAKLASPGFVTDIRPLLSPEDADKLTEKAMRDAFIAVFDKLITAMTGEPWAKTQEMQKRFGIN